MSKTFDQESSASLSRKEALARDRQAQEQRTEAAQAEAAQRTEQLQRANEYIERLNAQLQHMQERIEALHERVAPLTPPPAPAVVVPPAPPRPIAEPTAPSTPTESPTPSMSVAPARPWPWLIAGWVLGCVVGGTVVLMRLQQPKGAAARAPVVSPAPRPAVVMPSPAPFRTPVAAKPSHQKSAPAARAPRGAPTLSLLPAGSNIQEWTPPRESLITVEPGTSPAASPSADGGPTPSAEPVLIEPRRGPFRI